MKKITLFSLLVICLAFLWKPYAQVLNQNASWPNVNWTVTGVYNTDPLAFEADPTTSSNFAFDDDDAGSGNEDNIAAESPVIDLTTAHAAGETWLNVSAVYVYRYLANDELVFQYWDADASNWLDWGDSFDALGTDTTTDDDFCSGTSDTYNSTALDITSFTPTQLSGFRYRISYDDDPSAADYNWGFCFESPTITSSTPPTCFAPTNVTADNITTNSVMISWVAEGSEMAWEYSVQLAGTGEPAFGTITNLNPFTVNSLNSGTVYELYVRAYCSSDDRSSWVGPINFTTLFEPPTNDDCTGAVNLTTGGVYTDNPVDGSSLTAATNSGYTNSCGGTGVLDVWYTVTVPASGNITIATEADIATGTTGCDTAIEVYTSDSDCTGTLTSIGCDDDGAATGAYSELILTSLTPGQILYIRLWGYGDDETEPYSISAFDASLSTNDFESNTLFSYYPNPVKEKLQISSQEVVQEITIINMLGQRVINKEINTVSPEINLSNLKSGAYFLQVTISGVTETIRIIKQ